jgi:archaeal flagellin FlaB
MKNLYSENAFTGLEAAIVLIAFVVVAAVFSYVVLGAGFFTSQTAQATVHTGVQQASSSMELKGDVYAIKGTGTNLRYINTSLGLTAGGTPIDLSAMVISYNDENGGHNANVLPEDNTDLFKCGTIATADAATSSDMRWCIGAKNNAVTTGPMLDNNAEMIIMIGMPADTAIPNTKFSVNFQPSVGAVLPVAKTIPGGLDIVNDLH